MVGRTNVGGSGGSVAAYAYIQVAYPTDSICIITNGQRTFTASDSNGLYIFSVPQPNSIPELWTVSCSSGNNSDSKTILISSKYQTEFIELSYGLPARTYTSLNYIQGYYGDGAYDYIDTGLDRLANNEEIDMIFDCPYALSTNSGTLLGIEYNNVFQFGCYSGYFYWNGSRTESSVYSVTYGAIYTMAINNSNNYATIAQSNYQNGEHRNILATPYPSTSEAAKNAHIYLFAGSATSQNEYSSQCRVYSYIRKNKTTGENIQEFVPCQRNSDGVKGFYDVVNKTFHPMVRVYKKNVT